ncbi:MAG: DNA-binding response regulator [Clostridia bacterium]|nr:MAG: DNA-binding response regulator [Clostridia bacterium]
MTSPIRIFIVDDHSVLRAGLTALLAAEPDMRVVGEAWDGASCLDLALAARPDVILLDINMPGMNGLEALKRLRQAIPECKVLILTMHDDADYLRRALKEGSAGYLLKQAAGEELIMAIRTVASGGVYLHPQHTRILLEQSLDWGKDAASGRLSEKEERFGTLSERESQVFRLVALGYRNHEIADKLFLSVKTVETYKARVRQKLGLRSRVELVRYALELGLLNEDGDKEA